MTAEMPLASLSAIVSCCREALAADISRHYAGEPVDHAMVLDYIDWLEGDKRTAAEAVGFVQIGDTEFSTIRPPTAEKP